MEILFLFKVTTSALPNVLPVGRKMVNTSLQQSSIEHNTCIFGIQFKLQALSHIKCMIKKCRPPHKANVPYVALLWTLPNMHLMLAVESNCLVQLAITGHIGLSFQVVDSK